MKASDQQPSGEGRLISDEPSNTNLISRACLTPETRYQFGLSGPSTLQVRLVFPFRIGDWVMGNSAVTEGPKLQRYDQAYGERARIEDLIRAQMEPVGADCYRVMREIDAALGLNRVEDGIAQARRRTARG